MLSCVCFKHLDTIHLHTSYPSKFEEELRNTVCFVPLHDGMYHPN